MRGCSEPPAYRLAWRYRDGRCLAPFRFVSFSHWPMAMGRPYDLPYPVEPWDDADSYVEELIALTGDYRVARAAFDEAVKRRPGRIVTLRQKDSVASG